MSPYVQQVLSNRRIEAERPWTIPVAVGIISLIGVWPVGKLVLFSALAMFFGAFTSPSVRDGGAIVFVSILSGVPFLVAPLYGLWFGRNWAWWLVTAATIGAGGMALMSYLDVYPPWIADQAPLLRYAFRYPLPAALGSSIVLSLLLSPATRRWLLFCYRVRSQQPGTAR